MVKIAKVLKQKKTPVWIWQQLMRLAIIVIGLLPILSTQLIDSENKFFVFALAGAILIVGALGEIWRPRLTKNKKDIKSVVRVQILLHFLLLTLFIQLYGRINGPLFLLYLPVVMEAFLSKNVFLGNAISLAMIFLTGFEYLWLYSQGEVGGLLSYIEFAVRILSLVFIRAYGMLLAKEMILAEKNQAKIAETAVRLQKANVRLRRLSALKDELVSVSSHALRSPLTTVKGYLSMVLEGDAGKLSPKTKEFIGDAFESNDRMIRLVNNILNVSRIESGGAFVNQGRVQPEKVIEKVISDYQSEAKKNALKLTYMKPREKLPQVLIDPDWLREIIANLVANAINFTPQGKVTVENRLKDGQVITIVKDTGIGIEAKDQKKLFKKFSQVNGTGLPAKRGSGLGLYICKKLLEEFNGRIWLKSTDGQGSHFYFSLPAIPNLS